MLEGEHKAEVDRRVRGQKTSAAAILARKAQVYITDCNVYPCVPKKYRYFDFKHLKIYAQINVSNIFV